MLAASSGVTAMSGSSGPPPPALLHGAIEAMPDGFAVYDPDDRLVICNRRFKAIWGYEDAEIAPGTERERLVRRDVGAGLVDTEGGGDELRRWIAGERPGDRAVALEVPFADGRWFLLQERPLDDGSTVSIQTEITTIKRTAGALSQTERRLSAAAGQTAAAEREVEGQPAFLEPLPERRVEDLDRAQVATRQLVQSLRASESRLRAFLDNCPHALTLKDLDGRFTEVNREFLKRADRPADEIVGHTALQVWREPATVAASLAHEQQVRSTGVTTTQERAGIDRQGRRRTLQVTKFVVPDESGVAAAIGSFDVDVTEQKEAERALQLSEARLRALIDNAPIPLSLKDPSGRYRLANQGFADKIGRTIGEILGRTARDLGEWQREDTIAAVIAHERAVFESGVSIVQERTGIGGAGTEMTLLVTKFPVPDERGKIVAIGSFDLDITERKATERQLRQSEATLRAFTNNAPIRMSLRDLDDRILMMNQFQAAAIGLPAAEIIGKTRAELPLWRDQGVVADSRAQEREVIGTGVAVTRERHGAREVGGWVHLLVTKFPVPDEQGRVVAIGSVDLDITGLKAAEAALRESEARLSAFVQNAPHSLTLKDLDGRHLIVNQEFSNLARRPMAELLGKASRARALWQEPELVEAVASHDREVVATARPSTKERAGTHLDGRSLAYLVTKFPVFDPNGTVNGVGTFHIDITAQKAAERALRESEANFRQLIQGSIQGIVIHRDNRPLFANQAYADIFGFERPEDVVALDRLDVLIAAHDRERLSRYAEARARGEPIPSQYEYDAVRRDGAPLTLQSYVSMTTWQGAPAIQVATIDVTQRKRAERELAERERFFRALVQDQSEWVSQCDSDYRLTFANRAICAALDTREEDLVGRLLFQSVPAEIRAQLRAELDGLTPASPVARGENVKHLPGGQERRFAFTNRALFDDAGKRTGMLSVGRDITAEFDANQRLKASEQRFRDFAEASSDWFWETGADLAFSYLSGRDTGEADAGAVRRLRSLGAIAADPEFAATDGATQSALASALEHRQGFRNLEIPVRDDTGQIRYFRISGTPMTGTDRAFAGYRGVATDVTEVVEGQRRAGLLRDAIDGASDAVVLYDPDQRVVFTNDEFHRVYPSAPSKEAVVGALRETVLRAIYETMQPLYARNGVDAFLVRMRDRVSGDLPALEEVSYTNGRTYLRRYRHSSNGGALVLLTDITARKDAERRLEEHQSELRRLASEISLAEERERRRISVELHDGAAQNLGLTQIRLGSLRAKLDDADLVAQVEAIRELIHQSIREVRSLMSELSPPMLYELGLEPAVEWLAERFHDRHGLTCDVVSTGAPPAMPTDVEICLFQAVRELLMNIVKHADASGASVAVRHHDDLVEIEVADDGRGMAPAQAGSHPSDAGGFGLFSLRERISLLGGRMEIESEAGTTIKLSVPVVDSAPVS